MRFELRDAWRGWRHATTPDNLKVEFTLEGTTRCIDCSVELLLEFYGYVIHGEPCHLIGGSGTALEIDEEPTDVRFRINYSVDAHTTYEELEEELVPLLREVFDMHDRLGQEGFAGDRREAALERVQERVERAGVAYDVRECYDRLAV
jgi:hypothetical protein